MKDINNIEINSNISVQEAEAMYSEYFESAESILVAKCSYPCVYSYAYGRCCLMSGDRCERCPSDIRLKNIISDNLDGLSQIERLSVKNFTYKDDLVKTVHVGVIAQDLEKIFPNAVIAGEDGYLSIRTEDIFYAMVNSIKELSRKNTELEDTVNSLKEEIKAIKSCL